MTADADGDLAHRHGGGSRPPLDLSAVIEWDAVVIRTDYSDDPAWQLVAAALEQPWGDGLESSCRFVDDSGWAGAGPEEVLAALPPDPPEVVFLADAATMRRERPLLAVSTESPGDQDDEPDLRPFRLLPEAVAEMVANLALGNMDYDDFSRSARSDSEKIHRGFCLG